MADVTIYHNPNCSTSKHAVKVAEELGVDADIVIYQKNPPDAETWLREATQHKGTWWDDYVEWLGERSGAEKPARKRLGGKGYKPLDPAPGTYVLA